MNKEEIKHFKSLLRQGSLRHMNILLDDKFQKELLNLIKDYEKLQQENKQLKEQLSNNGLVKTCENCEWFGICPHSYKEYDYKNIIDELEKWLEEEIKHYKEHFEFICKSPSPVPIDDTRIILEKDDLIIQKLESTLNKLQELKGSDEE